MADSIQVVIESLKRMIEQLQTLQNAVAHFQSTLLDKDRPPEAARRFSDYLKEELAGLDKTIRENLDLLQKLGAGEGGGGGTTQPVSTSDLADHFRSVVDTIQLQAMQSRSGQVATTLKSLDVELKALIVVQDNATRLITPSPQQTFDAGQLSTIRMSFNAVPVVQPPPGAQPPPGESKK